MPTSRRNGLVISEWGYPPIWSPGTGSYDVGGYLEVANNGDSTLYLDGLLVGDGWTQGVEFANLSCATVAGVTNDPSGIWVRRLGRFPGSGRQYPLVPGAVAVIATDAIDHRPLSPYGVDLSGANFEFIGTQDVDNPSVPNMIDGGVFTSLFLHGMDFDQLWSVPFLAKNIDVSSLTRQRPPFFNGDMLKVPAADLLDAAAFLATYDFPVPLCPQLVNAAIDRRTARLIGDFNAATEPIMSIHRIKPTGQSFLQDTRTSGADFMMGLRSPGREP